MSADSGIPNALDTAAFREMTLTVLMDVLDLADNLPEMSSRVVQHVRSLTGAKIAVLLQCLHDTGGEGHRMVGVEPARRRELAQSPEVDRLADVTHGLNRAVLWRPTGGGEAAALLSKLDLGPSIASPLRVGNTRLGCLLVLGLPDDDYGIEQVVQTLDMLSMAIALVFRTAILHETQEAVIAERTKRLAEMNDELRLELFHRRQTAERLRQSERELAVQNRIADVFLTMPDDHVYPEVLRIVLDATHSQLGLFGYMDEEGALVVAATSDQVATHRELPGQVVKLPPDTWGNALWAQAIHEAETYFSNTDSAQLPHGDAPVYRTVALPVVHLDRVIGLLQIANKASAYDQSDILEAEHIATVIAPILHAHLRRARQTR